MANLKDFATGTVSSAPSPATSGTQLTLQAGEGARMPAVPFWATAHPDYQLPTLDNAEKVLVTARTDDTLTITRAQGDTTAKSIAIGWRISNAVFAADLINMSLVVGETPGGSINGSNTAFTTLVGYTTGSLKVYLNGQRLTVGASNDYTETATGFTMNYAPATGDVLLVDYNVGSSTYSDGVNSHISDEIPTGSVNGSNTAFTTQYSYVAGTLEVFINGLKQARTTHVTETTPSTGAFTLDVAPATGDIVRVNYQHSVSAGGNADTVDGAHASVSPAAGYIPVTDSNNVLVAATYRNLIINGAARIAQRTTAPSLSTTSKYGKVDRFRCHATGSAVNAGTINQGTGQTLGATGETLHISGATITGTGVVLVRHRIEARDALILKNQIASFACKVNHDVGSSVNYTITIRKATASDNFASTTDIQASNALAVATGTDTLIALENVSMGDCSNGVEIEISVACGAVTTKNFHFTDFQFNKGAKAMGFAPDRWESDLLACQRYFEKSYPYADAPGTTYADVYYGGAAHFRDNGGGNAFHMPTAWFKVRKRTAPTMAWYNPVTGAGTTHARAGGVTGTNYTSFVVNVSNEFSATIGLTTTGSDFHVGACWTADAEL